jgi:hypothetical protein
MNLADRDALVKELRERMEMFPDDCIDYRLYMRCIAALCNLPALQRIAVQPVVVVMRGNDESR